MANQYIVWAPSAVDGVNTYSPAAYAALSARTLGVVPGVADPLQANTAWRQTTTGIAAIAQFVVNQIGGNMNDDGNSTTFSNNFTAALIATIKGQLALGPLVRNAKNVVVISGTTANIDLALGNYFVILMNANFATLTFSNVPPSGVEQEITVDFVADGTDHGHGFLSTSIFKWGGIASVANTPPTFLYTPSGTINKCVFAFRDGITTRCDAVYSGTFPA